MKKLLEEGGVYLCDWKKRGKSFEIQVRGKPQLKVAAPSIVDAEFALMELIHDVVGDMQPCFEYDPPLPKEAVQKKFEGIGIVAVSGGNDSFDYVGKPDELFTGGVCHVCKKGIGARTQKVLQLSTTPKATDGGSVSIRVAGPWPEMHIEIFSEDFVKALTPEERGRFKWLPVEPAGKSKKSFFEPISVPLTDRVLPSVVISPEDRIEADGFNCRNCGRVQLWGIPHGGGGIIFRFVAEDALPNPLPSCFQIGQMADLKFCFRKERWAELVGKPGTKRFLSGQVGIVKRNQVNTNPEMQILG